MRALTLVLFCLVTGCASTGGHRLITPDEDYAQGTAITVRVDEVRGTARRTEILLTIENRLPDPLLMERVTASLIDADNREAVLKRKPDSEICSQCTRKVTFSFDTAQSSPGVAEFQLKGLPVQVGPILLRVSGRADPDEELDGWDVAQKVIGITIGGILLIGLLALCIYSGADCAGSATRGPETRCLLG